MEGNSVIFVMLSVCILLGVLTLTMACVHYVQWRRGALRPQTDPLPTRTESLLSSAIKPLSTTEKKYFILFMEGKSTDEIASAMGVEPSSVYTMKYRIRKKFPADFSLPF